MAISASIVLFLMLNSLDLTLGQRKHGRTLPVAADVKPSLSFDCPEEFGYYPHPTDCTQYYVCVFGGALLESCTGGLMYSHELQTCDWPRNVGCESAGEVAVTSSTSGTSYTSSSASRTPEAKVRYTHPPPPPPPPAQPAAVVTSRGQPRQLQHNQQDLIKRKQQQQLYVDAEDALPPAEEVESDRQQRVYRGQPSTIGQVQKDRDGLRLHTNAIPSSSSGVEKIGVISFGTGQQRLQDYRLMTDVDNFLTNELTLKRVKRQIGLSHHRHRYEPTYSQILPPKPVSPYHVSPSIKIQPYVPTITNSNNKQNNNKNQLLPHHQLTQHNQNFDSEDALENVTDLYNPINSTKTDSSVDSSIENLQIDNKFTTQTPQSYKFEHPNSASSFSFINSNFPRSTPSYGKLGSEYFDIHNLSTSTDNPFLHEIRNAGIKYQNLPAAIKNSINRDQTIKIYNYSPTDSHINELKQLIDALTNFRNLQLYLRNINKNGEKGFIPPNEKIIPHSINSNKNRPQVHTNKPNITTKPPSTSKPHTSKIEPSKQSKFEPSKTKRNNSTKTDDYYYYDDDDEITTTKDIKHINHTTEKPKTSSTRTHYDAKKFTNHNLNKTLPVLTTESSPSNYTVYPRFPNAVHPPPINNYATTLRVTGKLTPSFGGPIRIQLSPARHKVENYRHRQVVTTPWHKINNFPPYVKNGPKRVESQSSRSSESPYSTGNPRFTYNASQYDTSRYEPYYDVYDDIDPDLYKNVEYTQHYSNPSTSIPTYRSSTTPTPQISFQEKIPKRGNAAYVPSNYGIQEDPYRSSIPTYSKEDSYNSQDEDQSIYQRQSVKQSSRRDQNELLNYIEEPTTTTKRVTSIKTTPPALRQVTTKKSNRVTSRLPNSADSNEVHMTSPGYTRQRNTGNLHTTSPANDTTNNPDITNSTYDAEDKSNILFTKPVISKPSPFVLRPESSTPKISFHYVTKLSRSTSTVSPNFEDNTDCNSKNCNFIKPTTYSPPRFFQRSFLKAIETTTETQNDQTSPTNSEETTKPEVVVDSIPNNPEIDNDQQNSRNTFHLINIIGNNNKHNLREDDYKSSQESDQNSPSMLENSNKSKPSSLILPETINYVNGDFQSFETTTPFKIIKVASPTEETKPKKVQNTLSFFPTRASLVNTALKSIVGEQSSGQLTKCIDTQTFTDKCKKFKKRVNNRGRGSSHYSVPIEETPINRGTPPARSRPTLKPSTSIVSKASEYIDIYRNPPRRPEPIYPQPQPDKTAAKCRKDVCLLPDCSCGGKEIPGDLDVHEVPQMVLMTFDDAVNDLNMGYYTELFERGRVNPNGCPIAATFYVSHEWTDYSQVQNLYADGHEMASHTVSHSFGEQFSQKKWTKEIAGQREILSAYGGVRLEDVRGMRAPFLSVGGNKMFKMLYDSNFTYDSSMPIYENKPPSWPYTLDYKLFHDCMIPPCPTRSYPGVWEVPMVMWQDLNGGRCSMGDACSNPPDAEGVFKMLMKNFERHYTTNRAPFGLFYHAAWFTQPHHKEGFIQFLDTINAMNDVWLVTNWQALQWVRDPTPISRLGSFQPFSCNYSERPKRCNNPKVCNLWHKTGVRYMRTCQPCPDIYPWTGNTGIRSSRIDNDIEE